MCPRVTFFFFFFTNSVNNSIEKLSFLCFISELNYFTIIKQEPKYRLREVSLILNPQISKSKVIYPASQRSRAGNQSQIPICAVPPESVLSIGFILGAHKSVLKGEGICMGGSEPLVPPPSLTCLCFIEMNLKGEF